MFRDLPRHAAYKSNSSPWLGDLPAHWSLARVKTLLTERSQKGYPDEPLLAATQSHGVIRKSDYETRTVTATKDLHLLKLVEVGDFVISLRSFQGGIERCYHRGIISPAYTVLTAHDDSYRDYLTYLFKSSRFIDSLTLAVTGIREGQNIDYSRLAVDLLPVPPVEEQAAIVKYLAHANARIDNAIAAKRRLISLLEEQMASSIDEAIMRSMTSSESRVIPLKYLVVGGLRYGANEVAEGTSRELPRYIRITDFGKDGRLRDETFVSIGQEIADKYPVLPGDILLARSGATVGKAFLAPHEIGPACHAGYLIRARCNSQKLLPNYLYAFTRSTRFAKWRSETLIQSTIENISAEKYGALKVPVPPINVQHAVVEGVKRAHDETEHAVNKVRREIFLLEEFRTRLVADAVTGQIDVRAIAATLPDAPADSMNRDVDTPAVDGGFDVDVSRGVA